MMLKQLAHRVYCAWEGSRRVHRVAGVRLALVDPHSPRTLGGVVRELRKDAYGIRGIPFRPDDVVVDIGAHVGAFAAFIATRYPFVRVVAYEPVPENFASLQANLAANGITNVEAVERAVTADGRELELAVHLAANSGGGSAHQRSLDLPGHRRYRVPSTTLDEILRGLPEARCRLVKIDCEGSEHEILRACTLLGRVEHLRGEFHMNEHLRAAGHSIEGLAAHCARFIPPANIRYTACRMAE